MLSEIHIRTRRLSLRPLRDTDGDQIVRLLDDFQVARWLTVVPHPYTRADFDGFLAHLAHTSCIGGLAIEEQGRVLGVVGLDPTLGYWLGQVHHGRGVMFEAASGLIDWAFRNHDREQIGSGYFEGNASSQTVLRKLGFRETGDVSHVHCVSQGIDIPLVEVGLSRSDWEARQ